jgi:NADH dehydrogenase (ubiquinone) 1 alpha subcomplex subunit 12
MINRVYNILDHLIHIFLNDFCSETLIEHGPGGQLIGVDSNGNKYFEKKDAQVGRNRWVVYAGGQDWINQNASTVPPEWHGWLHFISDENPANVRTLFLIQYII